MIELCDHFDGPRLLYPHDMKLREFIQKVCGLLTYMHSLRRLGQIFPENLQYSVNEQDGQISVVNREPGIAADFITKDPVHDPHLYLAPEVTKKESIGTKSDIFTLCMVYFLVTGFFFRAEIREELLEIREKIRSQENRAEAFHSLLKELCTEGKISPEVARLLDTNPAKRPSVKDSCQILINDYNKKKAREVGASGIEAPSSSQKTPGGGSRSRGRGPASDSGAASSNSQKTPGEGSRKGGHGPPSNSGAGLRNSKITPGRESKEEGCSPAINSGARPKSRKEIPREKSMVERLDQASDSRAGPSIIKKKPGEKKRQTTSQG